MSMFGILPSIWSDCSNCSDHQRVVYIVLRPSVRYPTVLTLQLNRRIRRGKEARRVEKWVEGVARQRMGSNLPVCILDADGRRVSFADVKYSSWLFVH